MPFFPYNLPPRAAVSIFLGTFPTKYEGQSRVVVQYVEYSKFKENLEYCQLVKWSWLDHTSVEGETL